MKILLRKFYMELENDNSILIFLKISEELLWHLIDGTSI